MKYLWIAACLFLLVSCSTKKKLIGDWKVEELSGRKTTEMSILKDGTLTIEIGEEVMLRNWIYHKQQKTFIMSEPGGSEVDNLKVSFIDPLHINLVGDNMQLSLTRIIKVKPIKYSKAKKWLIGKWAVKKIDGNPITETTDDGRIRITFLPNGIIESSEDEQLEFGNWVLSNNGEKVIIRLDGEEQAFELTMPNRKEMTLSRENRAYTFAKTAKVDRPKNNKKVRHRLVGDWSIIEVEGTKVEENRMRLLLDENGTVKTFENGQVNKTGQWKVSEDGNFLILMDSGEDAEDGDRLPIIMIEKDFLEFADSAGKIRLKRIRD